MTKVLMTTEERKRDKFATRNLNSMENLPHGLKSRIQKNLNDTFKPQSIFCYKCKKDIPTNYWKQYQRVHDLLHIEYLKKRYDVETRILDK